MASSLFSQQNVCTPSDEFLNEAPLVRHLYLYTGGWSFLCVFSVLMIYMCNKRLRMHPNGILIHLMLAMCVFSLDYLANGVAYYWKNGRLAARNNMWCESFGLPSTGCTLESTVVMFFSFSFIGWNFVWLYDLVKVFKQPMHTTDQLLSFYKLIVYLAAAGVVCGFYRFRDQVYTMVLFLCKPRVGTDVPLFA